MLRRGQETLAERRRIAGIAAAAALLGGAAAMPADARASSVRAVELEYRFVVRDLPAEARRITAYVPVPPSNARQELASYRVEADYPYQELIEQEYGNRFLRFDLSSAPKGNGGEISLAVVYRVKRSAYRALAGSAEAAERPTRFLAPDRLVPVDGKIAEEARRVVGQVDDPLQQARRLYDHVAATVRYDKSGQGWGRGDAAYACDVRSGNCTDFHSLFIGEARALGIPARFIMGLPLPEGKSHGVIPGYHCWAEFSVDGVGWIPVDASEASKFPEKKEAFFGGLDANRIQFTVGRDITLPRSQTGPANYSIYPQVEVDGALHSAVETRLSFTELTPAMHKVHHSRLQPETDSNFTAFLSVWDRLFGTFCLNPRPELIQPGLAELDDPRDQQFTGLLLTPFRPARSWPSAGPELQPQATAAHRGMR